MGAGASSSAQLAEIERLKKENAHLKRQTQIHKDQVANLMKQISSIPNKRTFLQKDAKARKRLAVSAEVLEQFEHDNEVVSSFVAPNHEKSFESTLLINDAISNNILFRAQPKQIIDSCIGAFEREPTVKKGHILITKGEELNNAMKFYVVESGSLDVFVKDEVVATLGPGDGVGELALMYNQPRQASVIASEETKLWSLSREVYQEIKIVLRVQRTKRIQQYLSTVDLLKILKPRDLQILANSMEEMEFQDGACIIRQGAVGDVFYIVEEGTVKISVEKEGESTLVEVCKKGQYFGERALLSEDKRAATCIADGRVVCLVLDRTHFEEMIGSLEAYTEGGEEEEPIYTPRTKALQKSSTPATFDFDMMEKVGILGEGAFGRVSLVKRKDQSRGPNCRTYALKAMQKKLIQDNRLEEHTLNEVKCMRMLNHSVILKLYGAYQDSKYLYLIIELCQGGEMFAYLREMDCFKEKDAKFYAAAVTLGFQEMHSKNICYRDLKPENLLMDAKGFLKICDFGLAKIVKDKTFTLCGTPDYLAPEIITSAGHNKSCDYWALGILIYEMIVGEVPFYADDPMSIYQLILRHHISFPYKMSRQCKDIINKLLESNPSKRLGNLKGRTKDIIKHKWFQGFNFQALVEQNEKAFNIPIKPTVTDSCDTSNFDISDIEPEDPAPKSKWTPEGFVKVGSLKG